MGQGIRCMASLAHLDLVLSNNPTLGNSGFRAIAGSVMRHAQLRTVRMECFGCALAVIPVPPGIPH